MNGAEGPNKMTRSTKKEEKDGMTKE